jgi:hypothetical protein
MYLQEKKKKIYCSPTIYVDTDLTRLTQLNFTQTDDMLDQLDCNIKKYESVKEKELDGSKTYNSKKKKKELLLFIMTQVFTAVKIQAEFFWVVTPCSVVVGKQRFRGP